MGCIKRKVIHTLIVFIGVTGLWAFLPGNAMAKKTEALKWHINFDAELTYDSNVYKLSATQKARLDANSTADQTSGRFTDMESVDDFVSTFQIAPSLGIAGLGGRSFTVKPSLAYNLYAQNSEKNFVEVGLALKQALSKSGAVTLKVGYAPNVFKKNYLSDAVDADADGTIISSEKVFTKAEYDGASVEGSYRRRLWHRPKKQKTFGGFDELYAKLFVGYENRDYGATFKTRSSDNIFAGADLGLGFGKVAELSFGYTFENLSTDTGTEVLIRNETDFGVDLNGDADTVDLDVRTVQNVNRSHNDHTLGVNGRIMMNEKWYLIAKYYARFRSYGSTERFDVTHIDRNDIRHKLGVGIKGKVAHGLTVKFAWDYVHNEAARDGLASINQADVKSYDRHLLSGTISYRL